MNTSRIIKTTMFLGGVAAGTIMQATPAFAASGLGYTPSDMATSIGASSGISINPLQQSTVSGFVTSLTTWLAAIAMVVFVFRLVLTGIDRAVFGDGKDPNNGGGKAQLPFVYTGTVKEILINFAKQMGIVLGAWVIVYLIMQALLWIFGAVGAGSVG